MAAGSPFPGVRPYTGEMARYYPGRPGLAQDIRDALLAHHAVTLFGPEGSGKSSLLMAEVAPALEEMGHDRIEVPGWSASLARGLTAGNVLAAAVARDTTGAPIDLTQAVLGRLRAGERPMLLILDQFEELIQSEPREVQILLEQLEALLTHRGDRLRLLIAVREEHLPRVNELLAPHPNLARSRQRIPPLSVEGAAQAIAAGASRGSPPRTWSVDALKVVCRSLLASGEAEDLQVVDLALLQIVAAERWEAAAAEGFDPTSAPDILRGHVTRTLLSLGKLEPDAWHLLEEAFVSQAGQLVPATRAATRDILHDEAQLEIILAALTGAHVVRAQERHGALIYELAHPWMAQVVMDSADTRRKVEGRARVERQRRRRRDALIASVGVLVVLTAGILLLLIETRSALEAANYARSQVDQALELESETRLEADRRAGQLQQLNTDLRIQGQELERNQRELEVRTVRALEAETRARAQARKAADALKMAAAVEFLVKDPTRAALFMREVQDPIRAPQFESRARKLLVEPLAAAVIQRPGRRVACGALDPTGTRALVVYDDGAGELWRADGRGAPLPLPPIGSFPNACVFSPEGYAVVIATDAPAMTCAWSADSGALLACYVGHTDAVLAAVWSADGSLVLTGSRDRTARLWSSDGRPLCSLEGHDEAVTALALSTDGRQILTGGDDGRALLWRWSGAGCERVRTVAESASSVSAVAFSGDSARVIVGTRDGAARSFDVVNGRQRAARRHSAAVVDVGLSPDGVQARSASIDGEVALWGVEEGVGGARWVTDSTLHAAGGWPGAWGAWIAGLTGGGVALVSDPADGRQYVLRGHAGAVTSVAVSPGVQAALSVAQDGSARLWALRLPTLPLEGDLEGLKGVLDEVSAACLSEADRQVYLLEEEEEARRQQQRCEERQGRGQALTRGGAARERVR